MASPRVREAVQDLLVYAAKTAVAHDDDSIARPAAGDNRRRHVVHIVVCSGSFAQWRPLFPWIPSHGLLAAVRPTAKYPFGLPLLIRPPGPLFPSLPCFFSPL